MTDIPVTMRDTAQLWSYMQHQEDVQYERMAKTYVRDDRDRVPDARVSEADPPRSM
jgi:hypothetical protein